MDFYFIDYTLHNGETYHSVLNADTHAEAWARAIDIDPSEPVTIKGIHSIKVVKAP